MLLKKRLLWNVKAGFTYAGLYVVNCPLLSQGRMLWREFMEQIENAAKIYAGLEMKLDG
jgi:hypothetical protein